MNIINVESINGITIDDVFYDVRILSLSNNFRLEETAVSGTTKSMKYLRDVVGTRYNYTLTVSAKNNNYEEYDRFYLAISAPKETMKVILPFAQGSLEFQAIVESGERSIVRGADGLNKWGDTNVAFIAQEPQRRL